MNDRRLFLVPAALLLLAVLPLPYGYYTFVRLVALAASVVAIWLFYREAGNVEWRQVAVGLIALLFNPILPVHLSRELWQLLDVLAAAVFVVVSFSNGRRGNTNPEQ